MRVHLQALGCRLNEAELETWARGFRARGVELAQTAAEADLVVVNTCAVTQESVRKSRNLIRRAQRQNPQARLIMSGCYAALDPEQAAAELGVDLVIGNQEKDRLVEIAYQELQLPLMPLTATEPGESTLLTRNRQRAFVKVQDGCRYRCSYCIVTLARGEERSRPISEIIDEINTLHTEGINEVVLAGVHLGGYGSDRGSSLGELISRVLADTRIPRIRLGSLEPWDLPDNLWELFDNPRLMPHLHLPMQSGADSVLRRMARRCRSREFLHLLETGRKQVPDLVVTTDIIVGFPGETEQEWQQTLDFVDQAGFGHVHIFAFSPREGTKAASLPSPVGRAVKRERSQQLHELAHAHRCRVMQHFIGQEFEVLIEGKSEKDLGDKTLWSGYTPNFLRVRVQSDEQDLAGKVVRVRLLQLADEGDMLLGRLAD